MFRFRLLAVLTATAFLGACERSDGPYEAADDYYVNTEFQGRLAGEMPIVDHIDADLSYGYIDRSGDEIYLELNTLQDSGWAMLGVYAVQSSDGSISVEPTDVVGCTGPQEYEADFDQAPEEASMDASTLTIDGKSFTKFDITAVFEGHEVHGTAVVPAHPNDEG